MRSIVSHQAIRAIVAWWHVEDSLVDGLVCASGAETGAGFIIGFIVDVDRLV